MSFGRALLICFGVALSCAALALAISPIAAQTITPQIGGGISFTFDGGISSNSTTAPSASFLPINATTAPAVSAGAHSVLQWERTQAWTAIGFITVASAPAAFGAAIIFTTCNEGPGAGSPAGFRGYEFWVNDQGKLQSRIISTYSTNYIGVSGSTVVTDGKRHKVAVSYDGSSTAAGVKLYVDGVLETPTVESDTLSATIVNTQPLWIGNQRGWPYSLGGILEQFSLSNTVRNLAAIQAYTTAAAALDANTVLAYNFSEQTGKITADLSSNSFIGAMQGAVWAGGLVGGAPYWLQGKLGPDSGGSALSSTSVSLASPVASGNAVVATIALAGSGTIAFSDDKGNPYTTVLQNVSSPLAGTVVAIGYATNITNAPSTITATLNSGTATFWRILAEEIVNIQAASPIDGSAGLYSGAATGTDGASSGNLSPTPTTNFDFIYGVAGNFNANSMINGTGFTPLTSGTAADNEPLWSEYFFQTTAGAKAVTFTPGTSPTLAPVIGMAMKSK